MGCPSVAPTAHTSGREAPSQHGPLGQPTYVVRVKGLVCPACAIGLKKGLMKLSFVRSIHVNYSTGVTRVYEKRGRVDHLGSPDDAEAKIFIKKLDKSQITKAIEDSGYNVDKFLK